MLTLLPKLEYLPMLLLLPLSLLFVTYVNSVTSVTCVSSVTFVTNVSFVTHVASVIIASRERGNMRQPLHNHYCDMYAYLYLLLIQLFQLQYIDEMFQFIMK